MTSRSLHKMTNFTKWIALLTCRYFRFFFWQYSHIFCITFEFLLWIILKVFDYRYKKKSTFIERKLEMRQLFKTITQYFKDDVWVVLFNKILQESRYHFLFERKIKHSLNLILIYSFRIDFYWRRIPNYFIQFIQI